MQENLREETTLGQIAEPTLDSTIDGIESLGKTLQQIDKQQESRERLAEQISWAMGEIAFSSPLVEEHVLRLEDITNIALNATGHSFSQDEIKKASQAIETYLKTQLKEHPSP